MVYQKEFQGEKEQTTSLLSALKHPLSLLISISIIKITAPQIQGLKLLWYLRICSVWQLSLSQSIIMGWQRTEMGKKAVSRGVYTVSKLERTVRDVTWQHTATACLGAWGWGWCFLPLNRGELKRLRNVLNPKAVKQRLYMWVRQPLSLPIWRFPKPWLKLCESGRHKNTAPQAAYS